MPNNEVGLLSAIGNWVSATKDFRDTGAIRMSTPATSLDGLLWSLSKRSEELIQESEPSYSVLHESGNLFRRLSELSWQDDFGEKSEMLRRFAYLCWRHARFVGTESEACNWLGEFDRNLRIASTERETFDYFFSLAKSDRSPIVSRGLLSTWEDLFLATAYIRGLRNRDPRLVGEEAPWLLEQVNGFQSEDPLGERDFLAADLAVSVSGAFRHLGDRDLSRAWEQIARARAERVRPRQVALELVLEYTQLANAVAEGEFQFVLARWGELAGRSLELGLLEQAAKFEILACLALIRSNRLVDAIPQLESLLLNTAICPNDELRAVVLIQLANAQILAGDLEGVELTLKRAGNLDLDEMSPVFRGDFVWLSADLQRARGNEHGALSSLLEARAGFEKLGMRMAVADVDLVVADILLDLGREEEARAHVLAALPTIEDQKMVRERIAAVALLRESVRRRAPDPKALRELRELLQKRH